MSGSMYVQFTHSTALRTKETVNLSHHATNFLLYKTFFTHLIFIFNIHLSPSICSSTTADVLLVLLVSTE